MRQFKLQPALGLCLAEWVRSSWAMLRLHVLTYISSFQVDTCWQTVHELGKLLFQFEILNCISIFFCFFLWIASKWCNPKRLVRARHGPLRPDTDPPTRQFRSKPDSWESPLVSVYWDDCYQTLIKSHYVSWIVFQCKLLFPVLGDNWRWTRKCQMFHYQENQLPLCGNSQKIYPLDLPECW